MVTNSEQNQRVAAGESRALAPGPTFTSGRQWRRRLGHTAWIVGLATALTIGLERFGFNPTDQGFVVAQSWRILHGEIPHRDLISARPLGSAYLHIIDFVIPGPLLLSSAFVACLQLIVATVVLAAWTTGIGVLRWGLVRTAVVASVAVINVHLFAMTAWHTVDGIFLVAVGWYAFDMGRQRDRVWLVRSGLFAIGFAAVTKQSFIPAVLVTLVVLLIQRRHPVRRLILDLATLIGPSAIYLVIVTAGGGFGAMIDQLGGGHATAGQRLLSIGVISGAIPILGVYTVAVLASTTRGPMMRGIASAIACLILGAVIVDGQLERAGNWGIVLWWAAALTIGIHAATQRSVPWRSVGMVLLGYMVSLSWGYASPTLLGGSLALLAIEQLVRDLPTVVDRARIVGGIAAVILLVATLGWMSELRLQAPYRDLPARELTADLGESIPAMRGIRTNPATAAYVEQIVRCLDQYPASRTAVLPDNPFIYPALHIRNPFPIDWPLSAELVADSRARLDAAAEKIEREGDYLILFQTVTSRALASAKPIPVAVPADASVVDPAGIADGILARISGQPVTCGSFVGVWQPSNR